MDAKDEYELMTDQDLAELRMRQLAKDEEDFLFDDKLERGFWNSQREC